MHRTISPSVKITLNFLWILFTFVAKFVEQLLFATMPFSTRFINCGTISKRSRDRLPIPIKFGMWIFAKSTLHGNCIVKITKIVGRISETAQFSDLNSQIFKFRRGYIHRYKQKNHGCFSRLLFFCNVSEAIIFIANITYPYDHIVSVVFTCSFRWFLCKQCAR